MSDLDTGWVAAREYYQLNGYLTDTDLPPCLDSDGKQQGWMDAYRHFHLTYTVPPVRPTEQIETPWNVKTWDVKPWDLAQDIVDTQYTINVPDVVFFFVETAISVLNSVGLSAYIDGYVNCGYDAGRVCSQDPSGSAPGGVRSDCVVKLIVSNKPA